MEPCLEDPFRRELESSLDRRNLGVRTGIKLGTRVRTRSSNSDGSHAESDSVPIPEANENFPRAETKTNTSLREESKRDSQSSSGTSRNSRSLDFEANKFSLRRERSISPKAPACNRQMTIACGSIPQPPLDVTASGDHKILNDKRRTWAVEELMSELTQMCKERVTHKKPTFQLKSTEIKPNFDPLEKLTREIHEMNRLRSEANALESETSLSTEASPINVCKISINSTNFPRQDSQVSRSSDVDHESESRQRIIDEVVSSSPKALKSPKSPKILDEYNEANILNDCNTLEGALNSVERSLSSDKRSYYQSRTKPAHTSVDTTDEKPCYSNVKLDRTKFRPKVKLKMTEPVAELRLTPSLEKLASEIQFLPAKRTSQTDEEQRKIACQEATKFDDSLERHNSRGILKNVDGLSRKLKYKGSFKTKREGKYADHLRSIGDEDTRSGKSLKKSSTLHCATIPECYRRFRNDSTDQFENLLENSMTTFKRRSLSLSDLEVLEINSLEEIKEIPRTTKSKPVPLPRTKIPTVKPRRDPSLGSSNIEISNADERASDDGEKASPRTIPEKRKTSGERRDHVAQDDEFSYQNARRNINIESSTAVGFKSLLCASDSGSDNCLQSKELLSSSIDNLNDHGSLRATRKSKSSVNFNERSRVTRESLSDDQVLSSNASSEALQSHSESELTATLDISSQASPVARSGDAFECAIDLPPGWTQKFDSDIGHICFINELGNKVGTFSLLQFFRAFFV